MIRIIFLLLFFPMLVFAQKKDKIDKIEFCGWKMKNKKGIKAYMQPQFDFLQVQEGDTIVDIGAQSGSYEGCFLSVNNFQNLSFILVDIDPKCLNQQKVNNMITHYAGVKGDSIKANFKIVQNTADSLWLPQNSFQKVWLLNTLHEIPDQAKMVRDIYSVLRTGGEIVILELTPDYEGQLHGGCHKPLMNFEKINEVFTSNGFRLADRKNFVRKRNDLLMLRFIKQ